MSEHKRIIAALDLPPRRAHKKTVDSFHAAAERWDAELFWIRQPLFDCHPFWQKLMMCRYVVEQRGHCQLLQLDTDMLIRDDCPSPFPLVSFGQMGFVSSRQRVFGADAWAKEAHHFWAQKLGTQAAPPWTHVNGGLYLYHTEAFVDLLDTVVAKGPQAGYDKRYGCDESIILNHLWQTDFSRAVYLPGTFNTLLHHNPQTCHYQPMNSYIYHFVGGMKRHLAKTWWQRGKQPGQRIPNGVHAHGICEALRQAGVSPRKAVEVGVFEGVNAANLLALIPELNLYGVDSWSAYPADGEQPRADHIQQISDTHSLHWCIPTAFQHMTVNADRWHPIRLPSGKAVRCFDDGDLDFVFIDGEHSYTAAKADVEAWWPKVRTGGLLLGHDYLPQRFPGVVRAVDEFAASIGATVGKHPGAVWSICRDA